MIMSRHLLFSLLVSPCRSFLGVHAPRGFLVRQCPTASVLFSSTASERDGTLESMRSGEIKKELERYGISTKAFLEKKELVEALRKARADGLPQQPEKVTKQSSSSSSSGSGETSTTTTTSPSGSSSSSSTTTTTAETETVSKPRAERLAEELEKCKSMKAGDMKKELEKRGISTRSFFEKSEFAKALAEAVVDGVEKKSTDKRQGTENEGYAEYANVEVLTSDDAGPRKKQSQGQAQSQQSPFSGRGSGGMPGGMGDMGGMGGMGGIADMLKNMGGMGGSPFGGASPFGGGGDVMGQAQQMMQNPKVRELMMKAQSNPKMMQAMQECMSNPAAFAKYQNDPEVSAFINELKNIM